MSAVMVAAFAMQAASVALVLRRVGARAVTHVGPLFIVVAAAYHGIGELVHQIIGASPFRRMHIDPADLETWTFYAAVGMFTFAGAYAAAVRPTASVPKLRLPGLPIFGAMVVTIYLATVVGAGGYWVEGLTNSFLMIGSAVVATGVIVRSSSEHAFRNAILVEACCLTLLGQRFTVVAAVLLTTMLATRYGAGPLVPRREQTGRQSLLRRGLVVLGVVIAAFFALTVVKGSGGAAEFRGTDVNTRLLALRNVSSIGDVSYALEVVYRLDGNTFGAALVGNGDAGSLGLTTLDNNARLAVPQFLLPKKLDAPITERNEELAAVDRFHLVAVDYLPTTLGMFFAYSHVAGVIAGAFILGLLLAFIDNWTHRRGTATALVLAAGTGYVCVYYESSPEAWFLTARAVVVLVVLFAFSRFAERAAAPRAHPSRAARAATRAANGASAS